MMLTRRRVGDEIRLDGPATIRIVKIHGGSNVLIQIDAPESTIITTTKSDEREEPYGHV